MMYLPRLCEHCLNPACVAVLPLRRDLQARGGRHRPDRPGQVPRLAHVRLRLSRTEIYFNWESANPRSASSATRASKPAADRVFGTCVGRIRYLGVMLYDADRIEEAASTASMTAISTRPSSTSSSTRTIPEGDRQARADGIPKTGIDSRRKASRLQDGDGLENRAAAASGIPHAADGFGTYRRCRRSPERRQPPAPNRHEQARSRRRSLRIPLVTWPTCSPPAKKPVVRALKRLLAMRAQLRRPLRDSFDPSRVRCWNTFDLRGGTASALATQLLRQYQLDTSAIRRAQKRTIPIKAGV